MLLLANRLLWTSNSDNFVHLDVVIAKDLYQIPLAEGQFLYIQDGHHLHEQFSEIALRTVAAGPDYPVQGSSMEVRCTEPHPAAPFRRIPAPL